MAEPNIVAIIAFAFLFTLYIRFFLTPGRQYRYLTRTSDYEAIIDVAEEAISRERYALETMKRYGVTREGLGLSKEPAVCGTLKDIIEAARSRNFDAVEVLIGDIDISQVKEKLLHVLSSTKKG